MIIVLLPILGTCGDHRRLLWRGGALVHFIYSIKIVGGWRRHLMFYERGRKTITLYREACNLYLIYVWIYFFKFKFSFLLKAFSQFSFIFKIFKKCLETTFTYETISLGKNMISAYFMNNIFYFIIIFPLLEHSFPIYIFTKLSIYFYGRLCESSNL